MTVSEWAKSIAEPVKNRTYPYSIIYIGDRHTFEEGGFSEMPYLRRLMRFKHRNSEVVSVRESSNYAIYVTIEKEEE